VNLLVIVLAAGAGVGAALYTRSVAVLGGEPAVPCTRNPL
jgi:hypothetical protein